MNDTEAFLQKSQYEAQQIAQEISVKTGFKIGADDPSIIALIAQRRWLEMEWETQNQHNQENIQHLNAFFSSLQDLLPKIQQAELALQEKYDYLKEENEILKSFRNELVSYFTAQAKNNVEPFVADMVEKRLSGSLNAWQLKSHLIFGGVIILQLLMLLIMLFFK